MKETLTISLFIKSLELILKSEGDLPVSLYNQTTKSFGSFSAAVFVLPTEYDDDDNPEFLGLLSGDDMEEITNGELR